MKRNKTILAMAAFLVLVAGSLFMAGNLEGSIALATVAAGAAIVGADPDKKKYQFIADAKGNLVMTQDQFLEATADAADQAVKNMIKELQLNVAPTPGVTPGPDADQIKQLGIESKDETRSAKRMRLTKAVLEISGGRLAVESAPKEIKFNRWLAARHDGDRETQMALGAASWGDAGRQKVLTEGSATDGGNLVPVEFSTDLLVAIEEYGIMRRDATIEIMTAKEKDIPTVTTKPTVTRVAEVVASAESASKFGRVQLTNDMYSGYQVISREEMSDNNVGLYERMIDLFGEAFAEKEDNEGLVLTYYPGVLGSIASTTNTTLAGGSILAPGALTYQKLVELNNSLSRGKLAGGGKYYMHRTIWGLIEGMVDTNDRPITSSPYSAMGPTLFGRPVELTDVMPSTANDAANTGFIIFGNLKWVLFGDREGIFAQLLREGTLPIAGGGTINLASQRAIALMLDKRWGIKVAMPPHLAILKTT